MGLVLNINYCYSIRRKGCATYECTIHKMVWSWEGLCSIYSLWMQCCLHIDDYWIMVGVRVVHFLSWFVVYLYALYSLCFLCAQCCQCLQIVYSWLTLRFSLKFTCMEWPLHGDLLQYKVFWLYPLCPPCLVEI